MAKATIKDSMSTMHKGEHRMPDGHMMKDSEMKKHQKQVESKKGKK